MHTGQVFGQKAGSRYLRTSRSVTRDIIDVTDMTEVSG